MMNREKHLFAVAFDLDDTLVRTSEAIGGVEERYLADFGIKFSSHQKAEFLSGVRYEDYFKAIERQYRCVHNTEEVPAGLISNLRLAYDRALRENGLKVSEGAQELLERLERGGVPFFLATNSTRQGMVKKLELSGLSRFFNASAGNTFCRDDVENPKPAPDLYAHVAQAINGADYSSLIVVEDSMTGIAAARALGERSKGPYVIGYTGCFHTSAEQAERDTKTEKYRLYQAGADKIVSTMDRVEGLIFRHIALSERPAVSVTAPTFTASQHTP